MARLNVARTCPPGQSASLSDTAPDNACVSQAARPHFGPRDNIIDSRYGFSATI